MEENRVKKTSTTLSRCFFLFYKTDASAYGCAYLSQANEHLNPINLISNTVKNCEYNNGDVFLFTNGDEKVMRCCFLYSGMPFCKPLL